MTWAAQEWARKQDVKGPTKMVLVALAYFADEDGLSFPNAESIAEYTGLSERAAVTGRQEAVSLGLVQLVSAGGGRKNPMRVRVPLKKTMHQVQGIKGAPPKAANPAPGACFKPETMHGGPRNHAPGAPAVEAVKQRQDRQTLSTVLSTSTRAREESPEPPVEESVGLQDSPRPKTPAKTDFPADLVRLCKAYPKPKRPDPAKYLRVWLDTAEDRPPVDDLLDALAILAASDDWKRECRRFVPSVDRFLRERLWENATESDDDREDREHTWSLEKNNRIQDELEPVLIARKRAGQISDHDHNVLYDQARVTRSHEDLTALIEHHRTLLRQAIALAPDPAPVATAAK
ncbi:MAG TPA: hypothetical protein DCQ64_24905 [Candidatus Rokubacteria bacterium]|nr:hypothetical protein [Candidatus Rokubacteria bacterium]